MLYLLPNRRLVDNDSNKAKLICLQGISNKQARLDYFPCNDALLSITKDCDIKAKYRTAPASITCYLITLPKTRGPGTRKLNIILLMDEESIILIKKEHK